MGVRFAIEEWAACAPGLLAPADWQVWARDPWLPEGALEAKLEAMQPMQRRRLNALGRAAAQAAWACHEPDPAMPVVFASGYGDAQRCLHLLKEYAATGAASPTDFALSVHNAIGAMYSIARRDGAGYSSIAAGRASAAAGALEAATLLADGAPRVLLVCYDAPLPGEYASFGREAACPTPVLKGGTLSRRRCYPSDTFDDEWALIEPLLPTPACETRSGGRPEKHPRREIVDAIRYVVDTG